MNSWARGQYFVRKKVNAAQGGGGKGGERAVSDIRKILRLLAPVIMSRQSTNVTCGEPTGGSGLRK